MMYIQTSYHIGPVNPFLNFQTNSIAKIERPTDTFSIAIQQIKELKIENPTIDWPLITTKLLYNLIVEKSFIRPQIFEKKPQIVISKQLKNIKNVYVSPLAKQHAFLTVHNILPTRDRMKRCRLAHDTNCPYCLETEDVHHITTCIAYTPIIKYFIRKIIDIYSPLEELHPCQILKMNFSVANSRILNVLVWLITTFHLIIWKSRKKTLTKETLFNTLNQE